MQAERFVMVIGFLATQAHQSVIGDSHGIAKGSEVFFDQVKVPVENRVGEETKGWTYAKFLLVHERSGIAGVARSKKAVARLRELIKDRGRGRSKGAMLLRNSRT